MDGGNRGRKRFCSKECSGRHTYKQQAFRTSEKQEQQFPQDYIAAMCKQFRATWPDDRFGKAEPPVEIQEARLLMPDRFSE
jgi:hypothetical protein